MRVLANALLIALNGSSADAQYPSLDTDSSYQVEIYAQSLLSHVKHLREALDLLGSPLSKQTQAALDRAMGERDQTILVKSVQQALASYCLMEVHINLESEVKAMVGAAKPELAEQGWRIFLVKVTNEAGVMAPLRVYSPQAEVLHESQRFQVSDRWLSLRMFNRPPLQSTLSGLKLEYLILQLYSRDAGKREAQFTVDVGLGTKDHGFSSNVDISFHCVETAPVTLRIFDENGKPTTASFVIRGRQGMVHPSQAKRLAPDFPFHPQIYRVDGAQIKLTPGEYTFVFDRGPEYLRKTRKVTLNEEPQTLTFSLERWVDPAKLGWWSGDDHVHAAGCLHYHDPTHGFHPTDMALHFRGEDLKVGCVLTWGPGFDYQKHFFSGKEDKASQYPYLLRYDIEVSDFGSTESGHLVLLGLKDMIPPGGHSKHHWSTLGLNTIRWAKQQGAVVGIAHAGDGLEVESNEVPNYIIPPYNGIGANEYIVDVTHEVPGPDGKLVSAVDFVGVTNTSYPSILNIWYHTLNCGFRTGISGETDWPCFDGERVGRGRVYAKVVGTLNFDAWAKALQRGQTYVSDGKSHLMDFEVNGVGVGNRSELRLEQSAIVRVTAKVAALLSEKQQEDEIVLLMWPQEDMLAARRRELEGDEDLITWSNEVFWNLEHARLGKSRKVRVQVVVNAYAVAEKVILADGKTRDLAFEVRIERSSWVALRILGAAHTSPVFVLVGDKPIRASRRSAEWCLKGVDQCWSQKKRFIHSDDMEDAIVAYDRARRTYRQILSECEVD